MKNLIKNLFDWHLKEEKDFTIKNEIKSNIYSSLLLLLTALGILATIILREFEILEYTQYPLNIILWSCFGLAIIPGLICFFFKGRGAWIKYMLLTTLLICSTALSLIFTSVLTMIFLLPIIMATKYRSRLLTLSYGILSYIFAVIIILFSPQFTGDFNYSLMYESQILKLLFSHEYNLGEYMNNAFRFAIIPMTLIFISVLFICVSVTLGNIENINEVKLQADKEAKTHNELELAQSIQLNMLPKKMGKEKEADYFLIDAMMVPAKEVGGDFYDYFMIDETHVGVLIADVSGKGVAAGMFMAKAKTLIKSQIFDRSISECFEGVNKILCEGNENGLFITAWLGVLALDSGLLTFSNAGHCPPIIINKNGVSKLNQQSNFILAGLSDSKYPSEEYQMEEGDTLLLYTDGVTEAMDNQKHLYGDRLLSFLNKHKDEHETLLSSLKQDVDNYQSGKEQSDDITMLSLWFRKKQTNIISQEFEATTNNIKDVLSFTDKVIQKFSINKKDTGIIKIIVEEIYLNIASYAYKYKTGKAYLGFKKDNDKVTITFKDQGSPFNPLKYQTMNIETPTEKRKEGGLGIQMVMKMADDIKYRYDGSNILTIVKKLSEGDKE